MSMGISTKILGVIFLILGVLFALFSVFNVMAYGYVDPELVAPVVICIPIGIICVWKG